MFVMITIGEIITITFLLILLTLALIVACTKGITACAVKLKDWRKSGCWKHDFELYSTRGSGNYADYKCKTCSNVYCRRI